MFSICARLTFSVNSEASILLYSSPTLLSSLIHLSYAKLTPLESSSSSINILLYRKLFLRFTFFLHNTSSTHDHLFQNAHTHTSSYSINSSIKLYTRSDHKFRLTCSKNARRSSARIPLILHVCHVHVDRTSAPKHTL